MKIVSDSACEKASGTAMKLENGVCTSFEASMAGRISQDMVCAGGGNTDTCIGDGGAPLSVKQCNQHSLAGIASYGIGCADVSSILFNFYHHVLYISFHHIPCKFYHLIIGYNFCHNKTKVFYNRHFMLQKELSH